MIARRPSFVLHLCTLPLCGLMGCSDPTTAGRGRAAVQRAVEAELGAGDTARVFINLREAAARDAPTEERRQAIRAAQERVLAALGETFTVTRRYSHVPALAGVLTRAGAELAATQGDVASIQRDNRGAAQLKEAVPLVGGDIARTQYGLTGKGVVVAILDSGVDAMNVDLKDSIVAQHCFTQSSCPPNDTNEGTTAPDGEGHGTNVTGIFTSNGVGVGIGYAPDSAVVAVRVLDSAGRGQSSDWVAGLDWVYDNLASRPVDIINMSLDTDALYTSGCDADEQAMAAAVQQLRSKGVTIFASSGNNGSSTSMASPACVTGVIAVGATYDSNLNHQPPTNNDFPTGKFFPNTANCSDDNASPTKITCFTNSNARLDLVAPGAYITSTFPGGSTTHFYYGTSQASPTAGAVAALLKQCNPKLSPDELLSILKETGVPTTDARNGLTIPAVHAIPAIQKACPGDGGAVPEAGLDAGRDGGGGADGSGGGGDAAVDAREDTAGSGGAAGSAGASGTGGAGGNAGVGGGAGAGARDAAGGTGGIAGNGGAGGFSAGGAAGSGRGGAGGDGAGGTSGAAGSKDAGDDGAGGGSTTGGSAGNGGAAGDSPATGNTDCSCRLARAAKPARPSLLGGAWSALMAFGATRGRRRAARVRVDRSRGAPNAQGGGAI